MLRITLKSLFSTLHISGKLALMISSVMPSLPGAFLFFGVLRACTTSALVIGRSKCADFVSFAAFACVAGHDAGPSWCWVQAVVSDLSVIVSQR